MKLTIKEFAGKDLHNNGKIFATACFEFEYAHDKSILNLIEERGRELAIKVNPASANRGDYQRLPDRILRNCISGVLAEYCWKEFINGKAEREIVKETEFTSSLSQIDLIIIKTLKKIEIRSSFPRNGIEFAIFNDKYQFDILGPYANTVKPDEIQKDYYLRVLYPFDTKDFLIYFNSSILIYLVGGATWDMMINPKLSKTKNLIPEDEFIESARKSEYKVIPLSLVHDTINITDMIIKETL